MQKFSHLKSSGSHCGRWRIKGRMGAAGKGAERSGKERKGATFAQPVVDVNCYWSGSTGAGFGCRGGAEAFS